jgi:hypothetical protein
MNDIAQLHLKNWLNYFFLIIMLIVQGCSPDKNNRIEDLPESEQRAYADALRLSIAESEPYAYIEGSGYVDSMGRGSVVSWLSADKVIYGVNSTKRKNSFSGVEYSDLESSKQVNILDIITKNTVLYKKGQLIGYKNGKILIRLAMGGYNPKNNQHTSKPKMLYGNLDSETQEEYDQAKSKPFQYLPPIDKCPLDNTSGEAYDAWKLNSEHGCVRIPKKYGKDKRWIYYQANGQSLELMTSSSAFTPDFKWISWLKAYVIENRFPSIETTATVRVLHVNGKFELIDISPALQHAKPTKVGIIGAVNNKGSIDGLRLIHDGTASQITRGTVRHTEVSPDGCKVAYVTNQKLRVIDVCSMF